MRTRTLTLVLSLPILAAVAPGAPLAAQGDGELDLGFGGGDGIASWTGGASVTVADVAATEDLIIGVGSFEPSSGPPARIHWQAFDTDGALLATKACYTPSGTLFPFAVESTGLATLVDSSGNLLVGGEAFFQGSEETARALLARFDLAASGYTLDPSFSDNGWQIFDDESWCDTEDCAVVALGEIRPATGVVLAPRTIALVRSIVNLLRVRYFLLGLTADGAIDPDFGNAGWVEVTAAALGELGPYVGMAIDARGRIDVLVTRFESESPIDLDVYLLRFTASGHLDTTLGSDGLLAVDDPPSDDTRNSLARALVIDSEGHAIVGYRNDEEGEKVTAMDLGTGESGGAHWIPTATSTALAVQGNRRVLEVNDPSFDGDPAGFLLRAHNQYIFADGFDGGTTANWSQSIGLAAIP